MRVWSVESGGAVRRMRVARSETQRETLVWAIAVMRDLTVVTGDSRGYVTWWDGHAGEQLESRRSHMAAVLALAISPAEDAIWAAGVDPVLTCYEPVTVKEGTTRWVRGCVKRPHDHDVRCLVLDSKGGRVFSGGVDGRLAWSSERGSPCGVPPLPAPARESAALGGRTLVLRHAAHLELWRLGESSTPGHNEQMQLDAEPRKLLELHSRDKAYITCMAVSSDAHYVVYCTHQHIALFHFTQVTTIIIHSPFSKKSI